MSVDSIPLRPKIGTVVDEEKGIWQRTVVKVVETDDAITIHMLKRWHPKYIAKQKKSKQWDDVPDMWTEQKSTHRLQKFPCVNGPLVDKVLVVEEAPGYVVFNCSRGYGRWLGRRPDYPPTSVLVYFPEKP